MELLALVLEVALVASLPDVAAQLFFNQEA
jgi:hypothetical protein